MHGRRRSADGRARSRSRPPDSQRLPPTLINPTVSTTPRVVFLESQLGVESLFTRGLRTGAAAAGWETDVVFLGDGAEQPRAEKDVRVDLLTSRPDVICFLMDAP